MPLAWLRVIPELLGYEFRVSSFEFRHKVTSLELHLKQNKVTGCELRGTFSAVSFCLLVTSYEVH
jgi:hypothetical protein